MSRRNKPAAPPRAAPPASNSPSPALERRRGRGEAAAPERADRHAAAAAAAPGGGIREAEQLAPGPPRRPRTREERDDAGYLREVTRAAGRCPWDRLAVQVSRPVVHAWAASASEVLDKMAAMGADKLCRYLIKSIHRRPEHSRRRARTRAADYYYYYYSGAEAELGDRRRRREGCSRVRAVHVVLMQARDPTQRYAAVGDPMVGLIEASAAAASLETKDDATAARPRPRLLVQGVHVAGIKSIYRNSSGVRRIMWSAYLRQCKESHHGDGDGDGDGCRCTCVRNPDRVFQR